MTAVVAITMMLTISVIAWFVRVALRLLRFLWQCLILLSGVLIVLGQKFWAWLQCRRRGAGIDNNRR